MPRTNSRSFIVGLCAMTAAHLSAVPASAANFTVLTGTTDNAAKTLSAGQTGTVQAGGTLSVGGSTVAVTVNGNNATINNLGTMTQTGTGRVIRDNTGVTGLNITNGSLTNSTALMQAADADVIQMNVSNGSATLNNYGKMISLNASGGGSQAVDFSAITTGANTINNFSTGMMQATEADAVRPGVNGVVYNAGLMKSMTTTGSSSDGVDLQSNTGVQITNDTTGTIEGARHGITGGAANSSVNYTVSVTNNAGGVIKGDNGSGINIDGFNARQTLTVINNGIITGNGVTGDGDGIDSDGLLTLTNTGTIRSINAVSAAGSPPAFSEGLTVGGGTITNSGTIEGLVAAGNTNAFGRGITLTGNDITSGPLTGSREAIYGNATITNQLGGLIHGQNDSAIFVDGPASGFTVVINNNAGATILGGGATAAAIQTGADNDVINNAGVINGSSSGKAINMGAGNNSLTITGGAASILGDVNGGVGGANAMTIDPGAGNQFSYAGSISNFSSVEVKSGTVTFTGNNTYSGVTKITGGTLVAGSGVSSTDDLSEAGVNQALGATSLVSVVNGTLRLGDSNQINDLADLTLDNGVFDLNNFSESFSGGVFNLLSTSVIDFGDVGGGANFLKLGGLGSHTAGSFLQIRDYVFGLDHLFLSGGTLAQFASLFAAGDVCFSGTCGYLFDGTADGGVEIIPAAAVPEPMTLSLVGLGLAGLALRRRRAN